jgi:geranylgeranyl reductase family protein
VNRFDIVIVGGGPAGCRAAYRLARGGARVALVDGSHPREKPCGGGVTGRTLDLVRDAVPVASLPAVSVESASFEYETRRVVMALAGASANRRLAIVARRVFDRALLDAAVAAGATPIAVRATDVRRADGRWEVTTRAGPIAAEWLLGADGPNSLVRRRLAAPFERADLSIATGYFVHGATSRQVAIAFAARPAGYLWSFPRPDHLAVGICAQADESSVSTLRPAVDRWLARSMARTPTGPELERYSWPIPSLREATLERERPAGPGWLLLGDAAGLVDPLTREGIYFALASADRAADALLEGRDPAGRYARRLREDIYAELLRAARLKARFYRPAFLSLLVAALQRSAGIRATMADLISGAQPYHGLRRRLVGTFEWRLMLELVKLKL